MIFNVYAYTTVAPDKEITYRCPGCGQLGTFDGLEGVPDVVLPKRIRWPPVYLGQRRCPNTICNTHIFFAMQRGELLAAYPVERWPFDTEGIPEPLVSIFEEAITCQANRCYRAAAMLVRRCLEELCHEKGITASNLNLKARLDRLGGMVPLPAGILDALHNLRLLGNDAAHIESQDYVSVGKEEVELAIVVTNNVLQLVYQLPILADKLKAKKR